MPDKKAAHRKVRTGCLQCKRRHVKCDEIKPKCLNCVRYPSECSFELAPEDGSKAHVAAPHILPKPIPSLASSGNPEFSLWDFKLLNHWTLSTAESLADNQKLQLAMRDVLPRLAIDHNCLLHAIMAITALHLSKLHPEESESHLLLAVHHQNLALPLIRSELQSINEENCHAVYACGHLVIKYAFASSKSLEAQIFSPGTGEISEFLPLVRGAFSVASHTLDWLLAGPLGPSMERPRDENPDFALNPEDASFARLLPVLRAGGNEEGEACCEALNMLRKLLAMAATPDQTIAVKTLVLSWPAQVSQRYIELMSERQPEALVVLAHYCIMLKMIDSFWFMKGCAAMLLEQCRRDLRKEWHPHIEWPMSVVGLII
ncbi:hypothetical protein N431DRAFT_390396 [Stipitochalara longipes BDJ]|nr:hypothetical protein N431DRAFT_390396 [Stipitochalara longipes BDJ]